MEETNMEYMIITLVLWCSALLKVAVKFNKKQKAHSIYWYLQPFAFPVLVTMGDILLLVCRADIIPYAAVLGLLFELINSVLYRAKQKKTA